MMHEPGERLRNHFMNLKFTCSHCGDELSICWTCGGNGYYYSDRDGVPHQRYDCTSCNTQGLKHSEKPKLEKVE